MSNIIKKDKYEKGDYISTIPLGIVVVKGRKIDVKGITWYSVRPTCGTRFWVHKKHINGLATKAQINEFKTKYKGK